MTTECFDNGAVQVAVLAGINNVDAARNDGNGPGFDGRSVNGRVDSPGETRNDAEVLSGEALGKLAGKASAVG